MGISTQKDSSILVALIVAALLVITGGAWLFLKDGDRNEVAHESLVPPVEDSAVPQLAEDHTVAVDKAIQMAELAFQAGQLAEPADGSAVHFYREVLSLDPANPRALTGMKLISAQLTDEAMDQIKERNYEKAIATLNLLNDIGPESEHVVAVRLSLVEKTRIMYAAMDEAIKQREFDRAENLARRLRGFPEVDSARVSAALVTIATARNQSEAVQEVIGDYVGTDTQSASASAPPVARTPGIPVDTQNNENAVDETVPVAADIAIDMPETVTREMAQVESGANPGMETRTPADGQAESTGIAKAPTALNEFISPNTVTLTERQVAKTLATAAERVAGMQLMQPESDSAYYYFQQALILDPGNTEAKRGLRSLVQTLTADALQKGQSGEWKEADALLAQAETIAFAEDLVTQTRSEVKAMRLSTEQDKLVNISQFLVKKSVTPTYPRRAVSRSVEGWVTLEFVVDENGETRDIKVIDSSRQYASLFSKAAIKAVEQWQFKPRMFEGQAISQRSKTTVQFKLTD